MIPHMVLRHIISLVVFVGLLLFAAGSGETGVAVPTQGGRAPAPSNSPKAPPTPNGTTAPRAVVVANTGGEGVSIRRTTSDADKIKPWPDGALMLVIGDERQVEGRAWQNVQDPDGNIGSIPTEYLAVPSPTPAPSPTPDLSRYKPELLASSGLKSYGFVTVEGQVKNVRGASLRNVESLVQWYTNSGQFVKSDSALIEYNPILAGQTSPFTVISTDNPAMTKYSVSFKELIGGQIPTLDSRKR
ncbi:MAG: hypothetical protein HYX94_14250 [Chloroflexi bacterium]|nr:hypothetical protein [Chloroflexota bacterium]